MGSPDDHIYHAFIYALGLSGHFLKSSLYYVAHNWDKVSPDTKKLIINQIEDHLNKHELLLAENDLAKTFAVDLDFSPQQRVDVISAQAWLAFYKLHKNKVSLPSTT